jgi:hypothetical protein
MRGPNYTEKEVNEMVDMFNQGATYKEIAEMVGRTKCAVVCKLNEMGLGAKKHKDPCESDAPGTADGNAQARQNALNGFTIQEMVKNLYDRGVRIKNNKVVVVIEREVNLADCCR